jgi:ribose/xylose/arabinose/galactoside ABC-type transport system permease subunit
MSARVWLNLPVIVLILAGVVVAGLVVEKTTAFGRRLFLVGSNIRAADLSGIPVDRTLILAYILSGLAAGIAGIVLLARVGVSSPAAGQDYVFDALAAVVLGGTTFEGGRGGILGTVAGVLILIVAFNLVNILGLNFNVQLIVKGGIIIGAATLYRLLQRHT